MDLNILAKGLASDVDGFTPSIEDYSWISNVFVVRFKGKYDTFILNGINNPINDDYYNTMFYNHPNIPINKKFTTLNENSYKILNYIFFINTIFLFPNSKNYYQENHNKILNLKNKSNSELRNFHANGGMVSDIYHFVNKNGYIDNCLNFNIFFKTLSVSIYILKDCFKLEISDISDLFALKLVSFTYNIDEIKKFEKDYRNIIFKMFLKSYLDVKIEDFNMYNFNINKIFQF